MSRRFQTQYKIKNGTNLGDPNTWDRRFEDLDRRIDGNEQALESLDDVANRIEGTALDRINTIVTPLVAETRNRLGELTDIFATESVTPNRLKIDLLSFTVLEGTRSTFAPLGYVLATVRGNPSQGVTGPVQSYDRATGVLVIDVEAAWGDLAATYSDWVITATLPFDAHGGRRDNPHGTTAAQVGAYTKAEVDGLVQDARKAATDANAADKSVAYRNAVAMAIALG